MQWLWLICFVLTCLLLGCSIVVFFMKKIGIMRFLYTVGGCFARSSFAYDRSLIANIPAILSGLRRGEKKSRRSFEIVEKT